MNLWLLIFLFPVPQPQDRSAQERLQEERLINLVKLTPAKDFDSTLPKIRFERWLMDVAGKGIELRWEVNDCGEQTGDPEVDKKREIPTCVEADADLPGQRAFAVLIHVGNVGGKAQKPSIYAILIQINKRLHQVEKLRDLPKQLNPPKTE